MYPAETLYLTTQRKSRQQAQQVMNPHSSSDESEMSELGDPLDDIRAKRRAQAALKEKVNEWNKATTSLPTPPATPSRPKFGKLSNEQQKRVGNLRNSGFLPLPTPESNRSSPDAHAFRLYTIASCLQHGFQIGVTPQGRSATQFSLECSFKDSFGMKCLWKMKIEWDAENGWKSTSMGEHVGHQALTDDEAKNSWKKDDWDTNPTLLKGEKKEKKKRSVKVVEEVPMDIDVTPPTIPLSPSTQEVPLYSGTKLSNAFTTSPRSEAFTALSETSMDEDQDFQSLRLVKSLLAIISPALANEYCTIKFFRAGYQSDEGLGRLLLMHEAELDKVAIDLGLTLLEKVVLKGFVLYSNDVRTWEKTILDTEEDD